MSFHAASQVSPAAPVHAVLSRYGTPDADLSAICRVLEEETSRLAKTYTEFWPWRSIRHFMPNGHGIRVGYQNGCEMGSISLDYFTPYIARGPAELCRMIYDSVGNDRRTGTASLMFFTPEFQFLRDRAVPRIVEAKVAQAKAMHADVQFTIKCFGVGNEALEFSTIAVLLCSRLRRTQFEGDIHIACIGFDISLSILSQFLSRASCWNDFSRDFRGRVHLSAEGYYADLGDRESMTVALGYGNPDFTCWRRTHVMWNGKMPYERGWEMIGSMRRNLVSPGALVVYESTLRGDIVYRELV